MALLIAPALGQTQQGGPIDPRLAPPMIQALQAQLALAQAVLRAYEEDKAKKDADLAKWFKEWFGEPSK